MNADVRNQGHKGILVGGLQNYDPSLPIRRKLAECCATELCEVEEHGNRCRSFWLPEHGYNGLLYREGEHVIVIVPGDGEIVTLVQVIFTVAVSGQRRAFIRGKKFEWDGHSINSDHRKVKDTYNFNFVFAELENVSRKVMLQDIAAYYLAVKYRCEELQKGASDFVLANFVAVAETEDFLNLSIAQVEEWISSDKIIVKEEEAVFEVLVKWIERNESQKQSFYDLFRHIRCIYVHRDYLLNIILQNSFVKDDSQCSTCALDAMKMVFRGQEDCYFDQSPRNCLKTHEDSIVVCEERSTLCYIPTQSKWYKLADMLAQRLFYSHAISSCHGKLFFIGGNRKGCPAEHYDPSLNTWSPLKSFQQTIRFCSVVTFQGLLYVIGGVDKDNNRLSTVQRYNSDTKMWQVMHSLSSPRSTVCAVADESHLYAIGGNSDLGFLDIAERFDPKEKAWSRIASSLEKRGGASGAAVNQKVFVFGGLRDEAPNSNMCEMYDPITNMWSIIANTVVNGKSKFTSVVSFKGKIFVCGNFEQGDSQELMTLQVFDTVTDKWTSCGSVPSGSEKYLNISILRVPREVLDTCEVLS
ncbi:hypothetical protein ACROYT_G018769 [Oculina patagonica]